MRLVCALAGLLVCASMHGAELSGVVRTLDGPLPGVMVTIRGLEERAIATDEKGAYAFSGLPAGPIRIELELAGLERLRRTICLDANRATRYDPELELVVNDATTIANIPFRQKYSRMGGVIRDQFGTPIVGAAVLTFVRNKFIKAVASKADGSFTLRRVPVGAHISIVAPGYTTERLRISSEGRKSISVYLLAECDVTTR